MNKTYDNEGKRSAETWPTHPQSGVRQRVGRGIPRRVLEEHVSGWPVVYGTEAVDMIVDYFGCVVDLSMKGLLLLLWQLDFSESICKATCLPNEFEQWTHGSRVAEQGTQ